MSRDECSVAATAAPQGAANNIVLQASSRPENGGGNSSGNSKADSLLKKEVEELKLLVSAQDQVVRMLQEQIESLQGMLARPELLLSLSKVDPQQTGFQQRAEELEEAAAAELIHLQEIAEGEEMMADEDSEWEEDVTGTRAGPLGLLLPPTLEELRKEEQEAKLRFLAAPISDRRELGMFDTRFHSTAG